MFFGRLIYRKIQWTATSKVFDIFLWVKTLVLLVNIKIAGIYGSVNYPLTLILIGFDTHPYSNEFKGMSH